MGDKRIRAHQLYIDAQGVFVQLDGAPLTPGELQRLLRNLAKTVIDLADLVEHEISPME